MLVHDFPHRHGYDLDQLYLQFQGRKPVTEIHDTIESYKVNHTVVKTTECWESVALFDTWKFREGENMQVKVTSYFIVYVSDAKDV